MKTIYTLFLSILRVIFSLVSLLKRKKAKTRVADYLYSFSFFLFARKIQNVRLLFQIKKILKTKDPKNLRVFSLFLENLLTCLFFFVTLFLAIVTKKKQNQSKRLKDQGVYKNLVILFSVIYMKVNLSASFRRDTCIEKKRRCRKDANRTKALPAFLFQQKCRSTKRQENHRLYLFFVETKKRQKKRQENHRRETYFLR